MSEYTREEILKLIDENGGPEGLDLSRKDLSDIDLSIEAIASELEEVRVRASGEAPVWYSKWTDGINLRSANLQGADLRRAKLQEADLRSADLQGAALRYAYLQWADLEGANLQAASLVGADLQEANLRSANLEVADLLRTRLQWANLEGANLQAAALVGANLQGADLGRSDLKDAYLRSANLQWAYLWDAKLQEAILRDANLRGAILSGAHLQGADLESSDLQETVLEHAELQGANLSYSHLEKVDLFGAESLDGAYFYNAFLDDTRMRRAQLGREIGEERDGEYYEAKEAYLALKNNFAEIGRYDDAAWAYRKERRMEKATKAPWRARNRRHYGNALPFPSKIRKVWEKLDRWDIELPSYYWKLPRRSPLVWSFWFKYTVKWEADWFVQLLCDYGESVWCVLGWMVTSLIGFATYYWRIGGVWLVEPNGEAKVATSFWHYLIYSAGAFATTQFARLQAADHRVRMVTAIQAIVGIVLAGLLGFVAGNRIRRW